MAVEVRHFSVVVATGSTPAAPVTTNMIFPVRIVDWIEVDVPPGPRGEVGFYIASSRAQVLPFTPTPPLFLVVDDTVKRWELQNHPTSGDWQLVAYNTGSYPHTLLVTFGLTLTGDFGNTVALPPLIAASQLSS